MKQGDIVMLVKASHRHNRHLKGRLGQLASVINEDPDASGRIAIRFVADGASFWIHPRHVEAQDGGDGG